MAGSTEDTEAYFRKMVDLVTAHESTLSGDLKGFCYSTKADEDASESTRKYVFHDGQVRGMGPALNRLTQVAHSYGLI